MIVKYIIFEVTVLRFISFVTRSDRTRGLCLSTDAAYQCRVSFLERAIRSCPLLSLTDP